MAAAASSGAISPEAMRAVLVDFVNSPYARNACVAVNAAPMDYASLSGMFESVQIGAVLLCDQYTDAGTAAGRGKTRVGISDTTLVVKLKQNFNQRATSILDKLQKHLRKTVPRGQVTKLEYMQGTTIQTLMI